MKKLLLLGGSRYIIPIIKAAHELGIYVITCDYLPDNVGHQYSDEYHNVSIIDQEAVLDLARRLQIDGIMSFATDPGVIVAAYVAEKLGLCFCPYESVKILQNKDLFRKFLSDNNFNVPRAMGGDNINEVIEKVSKFNFPVIVKPVDSAGSKGVTKVNLFSELDKAVEHAKEYSKSGRIIVEEFIEQEGHSSDSDCFSVDNKLVCASFSCQYFDSQAQNPYAPAAYSWPSDMPLEKIEELTEEIGRLISLLNLGTSIYNIETRVGKDGKAYIMEVSPRGGGNRLSEVVRLASGEDMILNCVKAAVGLPVGEMKNPVYNGAWAEYIIHSDCEGEFSHLEINSSFEEKYVVEKDLWVRSGDKVRTFTGANEAIGTLVLNFDSQKELSDKLKEIRSYVKIKLK